MVDNGPPGGAPPSPTEGVLNSPLFVLLLLAAAGGVAAFAALRRRKRGGGPPAGDADAQ